MTLAAEVPTILVAHCNARSEGLVESLQRQGFLVLTAGDGAEAVEIARVHSRPIHVMVAEEGMNSRSLAATLKQYRPQMRVLFLTQFTTGDRPDLASIDMALAKVRELLDPLRLGPQLEEREARRAADAA